MMKVALICLFLSTSASAGAFKSCADLAFHILLGRPFHYANILFTPTVFALKRKIMRRFSQQGGHRPYVILKSGIDKDDYRKGLANLAIALEDSGPIWDRVKISSIVINDTSRIHVYWDLNSVSVHIPYNAETHSLALNLSSRLLEFAIGRKLKKQSFSVENKGLTKVQYKNALEVFYNALEKGPIPGEISKVDDITITKEGDISFPWSKLTDKGIFQTDLHGPKVPDRMDLRNLAGIHITKVGGEVSVQQRDDGLFDLYLPTDFILNDNPINLTRPLLPSP